MSRLCNCLLEDTPTSTTNKLQRFLNDAAKLIYDDKKFNHTSCHTYETSFTGLKYLNALPTCDFNIYGLFMAWLHSIWQISASPLYDIASSQSLRSFMVTQLRQCINSIIEVLYGHTTTIPVYKHKVW